MQKALVPTLLLCVAGLLSGCVYDEEYGSAYYEPRTSYYGSGYVRRDVVYENRPYYYDNRPRYYGSTRSSYYDRGYYDRQRYDRDRHDRHDDGDDHRKHHDSDKDRKKEKARSSDSGGRYIAGKHYRERIYVKNDETKDKKKKKKKDD